MSSFYTEESREEPNSHFILQTKQDGYDWVGHIRFNGEYSPQEQRAMMSVIVNAINNNNED